MLFKCEPITRIQALHPPGMSDSINVLLESKKLGT